MKRCRYMHFWLATAMSVASMSGYAAFEPTPVTADEAFDAVQAGTDPRDARITAVVGRVDVRTRAEYFWVGTAVQADAVILEGQEEETLVPDPGKVRLIDEGKFLEYTVDGLYGRAQVAKVASLQTTAISLGFPYQLRDEIEEAKRVFNPAFAPAIDDACGTGSRGSDGVRQIGRSRHELHRDPR